MMKTIFTNKNNEEQLTLISKEGQKYTLINANGETVEMFRIVLAKHYTKSEIEVVEENVVDEEDVQYIEATQNAIAEILEQQPTITTRKNHKHNSIKVLNPKGEKLTFNSIKEFAEYLEVEKGGKINKGHLYNLVNKKSKSYLGYRIVEE